MARFRDLARAGNWQLLPLFANHVLDGKQGVFGFFIEVQHNYDRLDP